MPEINLKILNLIRKEVASKCVASSITFGLMGILVYFYGFKCIYYFPQIKVACIFILIFSVVRFKIAKNIIKMDVVNLSSWNQLRWTIWINAVCWSTTFFLSTLELRVSDPNIAILLAIITGFVSASILTLSYDPTLFFPYQIITLLPLIGLFCYKYLTEHNEYHKILAITYTLYLFYQIKQYKDHRANVLKKFEYQTDLEKSLNDLRISQEALVSQTAKLMHISRIEALGEMAAGIAHEINNPLMVIQGSSEQIERSLKKSINDPEMLLSRVDKSKKSVQKIKSIIEALKLFSQEKKSQVNEDVQLNIVVDQAIQICGEMIRAHHIKLNIAKISEEIIAGNSNQLAQIIYTLINNADDALMKVENAEDRWISIDAEKKEQKLYLHITNGGPKINEELVRKLFQPFFTTKDIGIGTGLSLSISRGIALNHKGDLFYNSDRPNTTFSLELPLKQ